MNFINFTGSTPIGERIGRLAGMRLIMLELGGKDAAIVLEDADLENAAKQIMVVPLATLVSVVPLSNVFWLLGT